MTTTDLVIVGSGAAGLTAAITARHRGLDVLIIEKSQYVGGTSALSGGWLWVPGHGLLPGDIEADKAAARLYIEHEAGNRFDAEKVDAYLGGAPEMVEFLMANADIGFDISPDFPDYHPDAPGAGRGRSILCHHYDAHKLGSNLEMLRRPLRQTTFLGINIGSGAELTHFFNARRSLRSALFVTRRMLSHGRDMVRYGRGMRLANGNALVARLLKSALDAGVTFRLGQSVEKLLVQKGAITGVQLNVGPRQVEIAARRGVILACGGFSNGPTYRERLFPHVRSGSEHHSPAVNEANGDGVGLAEAVGAGLVDRPSSAGAWMPVSLVPTSKHGTLVFPHVVDRAKPGMIAVVTPGVRFVNESCSYHDFVNAMMSAKEAGEVCAWLICDSTALSRYGLGYAKPFPVSNRRLVRNAYLKRAVSLEKLAELCELEPDTLVSTVTEFNASAIDGHDPQFGKGSNAYNRFQGDRQQPDAPCVAPLTKPPFYAVKLLPGDIGTFAGLHTDHAGRVLSTSGATIPNLYAVGNDSANLTGGSYVGAGVNLGPAMTFGYLAALHASQRGSLQGRATTE